MSNCFAILKSDFDLTENFSDFVNLSYIVRISDKSFYLIEHPDNTYSLISQEKIFRYLFKDDSEFLSTSSKEEVDKYVLTLKSIQAMSLTQPVQGEQWRCYSGSTEYLVIPRIVLPISDTELLVIARTLAFIYSK